MLTQAVESYIAMRRATGYAFRSEGSLLQSFAGFSDAAGKHYVSSEPRSSGRPRHRRFLNEHGDSAK